MAKVNYPKICSDLLKILPVKQKEIINRRFALENGKERETLQSIGENFGITRERVRQIERDAILKLESEAKKYKEVFQNFREYLKKSGDLKREDLLLKEFGKENYQAQVYFLFNLKEDFKRYGATNDFYPLWTINCDSLDEAKKIIVSNYQELKRIGKPVLFKQLVDANSSVGRNLSSFLEISKKIQQNPEGLWGLLEWPEINPRGVKDKAYLVLKKEKKPLHFLEVASLIPKALSQTVHNELIKDERFVLVGRGIYALKEWGYERGLVKDVIFKVLKTSEAPLTKNEILEKVLKQRQVKENTVFLNLSNRKYFLRNSEGEYTIREA